MWFKKAEEVVPRPQITVVEIEKSIPLDESSDSISAVDSLRTHAGFLWLTRKLRLQGDRLKAELVNTKHTTLEEVYFLQSGIHWCNWLQSQLDFSHNRYLSMRAATSREQAIFEELDSSIERVGQPTQ